MPRACDMLVRCHRFVGKKKLYREKLWQSQYFQEKKNYKAKFLIILIFKK
jgi:hypothetical protein